MLEGIGMPPNGIRSTSRTDPNSISAMMAIAYVCTAHMVSLSCLSCAVTHHSRNWCDGMECHRIRHTVTPNFDPSHHDRPEVRSLDFQPLVLPLSGVIFNGAMLSFKQQGFYETASLAQSPDLSPIEHMGCHLGRKIGQSMSLVELEGTFTASVERISQDIIWELHVLMPDCITLCIHTKGCQTGY
ncbi:hypothetical protein TNCV_2389541 [Trichonephila clavipes]|nr:hypothetical protein TNCV_2389541 [Trichonephila clavipes]